MNRAVLHALFDLRDNVSEPQFRQSFAAFVDHLIKAGYACDGCLMRRTKQPGFGAGLPEFGYYASIEFHSARHEQACYDYLARDTGSGRQVHRAMYALTKQGRSHFFVTVGIDNEYQGS